MKKKVKSKQIKINEKTWERLTQRGRFLDTFDDVINRLLDESEGKKVK